MDENNKNVIPDIPGYDDSFSDINHEIHEECGIFGIYSPTKKPLPQIVYFGLTALQHRGQEACGIAVNEDRVIRYHKDLGLVSEVFSSGQLEALGEGEIAVGHCRYSTSGSQKRENAQPMVVRHVKGQLALVHNGNLVNSFELRHELEMKGCIFQTTSDTEVIAYIIIQNRLKYGTIEDAVCASLSQLDGAYSMIMMSPTKLIACRDPLGMRPLCYGRMADGSYVFASESCALDTVGAACVRELDPGELAVVDKHGIRFNRTHCGEKQKKMCIFEYIYFARSDSVMEGCPVHEARRKAGRVLAKEHPANADIVIGVPDSGLDAALGFSEESGIPYGIGLIKNKYIGRTFIAPVQEMRERMVRLKLNAVRSTVEGKRVVMIDDSIVRGTTCARIVNMIRDAGAKEVHVRISAPPFINPCYYGTDVDSKENLIASKMSIPEICRMIGADSLGYISVEQTRRLTGRNPESYCCACFDGQYPTAVPMHTDKERFEIKKGLPAAETE